MKKALFLALLVAFVLSFAAVAHAATPTVIDPVDGASAWTYSDAYDASPKREGAYRLFNDSTVSTWYADNGSSYQKDVADDQGWYTQTPAFDGKGPHGGYDTTTNKCKTCHAVHRAEGTYYLLRATSSDDACDYCHVGAGAHSDKVVYDDNPGGKYTNNGHTMGAGSDIPDSTYEQEIIEVKVERDGVDVDGPYTAGDIHVPVRTYTAPKKLLYRVVGFGRHPSSHPTFGYGDTAGMQAEGPVYGMVGPTALMCSSCHQTHNAETQIWKPLARWGVDSTLPKPANSGYKASQPARLTYGYKLLRRFPGASGIPAVMESHYIGEPVAASAIAKVPESTLLPYAYKDDPDYPGAYVFDGQAGTGGLIIDSYGIAMFKDEVFTEDAEAGAWTEAQKASAAQYKDWDGYSWQSPQWATNSHGWHDYDFDVHEYTMSVWCADCHNLNIGGRGVNEGTEELGFFKAHAERTHPAPASRGLECYSCHRGSLDNLASSALGNPYMYGTSSSNCHFASNEYAANMAFDANDWPHSSGTDDYKLLGAFSLANKPGPVGFTSGSVTASGDGIFKYGYVQLDKDNLDSVCLRCHTDIGVMN